jgi:hypothetical protein
VVSNLMSDAWRTQAKAALRGQIGVKHHPHSAPERH